MKQKGNQERRRTAIEEMTENFTIYKQLTLMLSAVVAYTQNQAADLAKALADGIILIESQQQEEQKAAASALFNQKNTKIIRTNDLSYLGMLDKLNKPNLQISQQTKSRIYHTIANIQVQQYAKYTWKNEFQINCIYSNNYKKLSEEQLDQIVKYETIATHTRHMGDKLNFKYQSIKKESQKMVKLLGDCMIKYISNIESLKYDLNFNQVRQVAQISKQACKYHDLGVFILFQYFVQSSKRLYNSRRQTVNIEQQLKKSIQGLYEVYPPGKGLSKENQIYKQPLKSLQIEGLLQFSKKKILLKSENKPRKMLTPFEKQLFVQNFIMQQAVTAEKSKGLFEDLIKATCLQTCISFKVNLKYYPNNPNEKSLTRIKEKMFFKNYSESSFIRDFSGSIQEILQRQQEDYKESINKILEEKQQMEFTITDMLRGKCIFFEVSDIIQTVIKIKDFIRNNPRYQLKEIQSRFTNEELPISDVTMKIEIDEIIVAELQLTIERDAPTYNFSHRIYELVRTKVFSKLKIIHNYYSEFRDDFNELASRVMNYKYRKPILPAAAIKCFQLYFKLAETKYKSFSMILQKVLQEKKIHGNQMSIVIDPKIQGLMYGIFSIAIGIWYKPLGKILNNTLKDGRLSPKLKSVLLSHFLNTYQLPKESFYMQQLLMTKEQLNHKIFMEEFIRLYFQIQKVFQYQTQNQKLFQRAQQLKQIKFVQLEQSGPICLQKNRFVMNLVIDQDSPQIIEKLRELLTFYFVTRTDKSNEIYHQFSLYYNWINALLQSSTDNNKYLLMRSQISIVKGQQLLESNEIKAARSILEKALKIFTENKQHGKILQCEILLAECFAKQPKNSLKDCIKEHQKLVIRAQALGFKLRGVLYADAMWRISEYLWLKKTKKEDKKLLLEAFTATAMKQMSRCKGKQFVYALCKQWQNFAAEGVKQFQILQNTKIKYVRLYYLGQTGCKHLLQARWRNLIHLNLQFNKIGDTGCGYLKQSNWKHLTHLNLCFTLPIQNSTKSMILAVGTLVQPTGPISPRQTQLNKIGKNGCEHLGKALWTNLTHLNLQVNEIGDTGCEHLSQAKWLKLTHLNLKLNKIGSIGCQHLCNSHWNNLTHLNLQSNNIGYFGCKHLTKPNFKNLTHLNLNNNNIGNVGCQYLSKGSWKSLIHLNLDNNNIEDVGYKDLKQVSWNDLAEIQLRYNYIPYQKIERPKYRKEHLQNNY